MKPKVVMISHGPIEDEGEGHFIHGNNVARAFSKVADIKVLEYTFDDRVFGLNGVRYIHLPINTHHLTTHHQNNLFQKYLSFDPTTLFRELFSTWRFLSKNRSHIQSADYVVLQGCLLISAFLLCKIWHKKIVIDTHWINYDVARAKELPFFPYHARRITWFVLELVQFQLSDVILVVSKKDYDSARDHFFLSSKKIQLIPQIIDFDKNFSENSSHDLRIIAESDRPIITFIGALDSLQNLFAVRFIKETLAPSLPTCTFLLIGDKQQRKEGNVITLQRKKNVHPYLQSSDILISPTDVGSGVKFKILDYLYSQKLIVATPPNFEGIFPQVIPDGIISVPIVDFARTLREVVERKLYLQEHSAHRSYVLQNHSLEALRNSIADLQDKIIL